MAAHVDARAMRAPGAETLQHFHVTPLYAYVRFGRWAEILTEPMPDLPYPKGVWHYARGTALVRAGKHDAAALELAKLRSVAADPALQGAAISGLNPVPALLGIAAASLEGEMAAARGDHAAAERHLRRAVEMQDGQTYDEPPAWHYPVRQSLGAALLEAGKVAEARAVFEEDLKRNPESGWSLFGLLRCLRAQGDSANAAAAERRFRAAWSRADVTLTSSRF